MRDLQADLEICNKATKGPWVFDKYDVDIWSQPDPWRVANVRLYADMQFIAAAREGWPHAIERAINAEAEVERLKTDMIDYRRGATYMTKKIQDLMAENIQLRNVESAAREVVWDCPTQADLDDDEYECDKECFNGTCPTCGIFRLQKVIAELDKEGE